MDTKTESEVLEIVNKEKIRRRLYNGKMIDKKSQFADALRAAQLGFGVEFHNHPHDVVCHPETNVLSLDHCWTTSELGCSNDEKQ